jgi:hypothetical protein
MLASRLDRARHMAAPLPGVVAESAQPKAINIEII